MDSVESEFRVSPPPPPSAPPARKSPPLAFAPTSNDALAPRIPPPQNFNTDLLASHLDSQSTMGLSSPQAQGDEPALQAIVDQQANAIRLLHDAFAAERQVWSLERGSLYQRITKLEQLLKNRDHHSPAKSPVISPLSGGSSRSNLVSPPHRATTSSQKLPAIIEDENTTSLSQRRSGAPRSINMPGRPAIPAPQRSSRSQSQRASSVTVDGPSLKIDEVPVSPPCTAAVQSPPPLSNRALAGHTPLKSTRPPTPPLHNMPMDGIEDTPTRNNTHINTFLSRSTPGDEDKELTGPLNLPELPYQPDETNFTLDALSQRLERLCSHPEEGKPMIFSQPTPGVASPAEPVDAGHKVEASIPAEDVSHNFSPSAVISPNGAPISHQPSNESEKFEVGGIKLKKKASTNFGAPFGQLGGFGSVRRQS
ncbi:hypothetical protein KC340_g12319 [Hortaea werneckii]|nr:hypothetical protein KC342_g11534 [Hortaea werneckii]KAI7098988.1 hypothetical protein KC339_g8565 [Hortaea werneckii]KAI7225920.1 hypothetical protein KC365_g9697 [Hortaea werneckii]KAI7304118.1 hypothetical protein KC340_g12319 [Hortaea werneckii]KAI7392065.1 hypothetical protein KC328_g7210 [Hortaea werneckii]